MLTTHPGQPAAAKPNEQSLSEPGSNSGVSKLVRTMVADVVTWQERNEVQRIPNQHAGSSHDDSEERNLGNRFAKVLIRREKSLGSCPSQVQLSPSEVALVNSVSGVPFIGCSATAPCNSNLAQQHSELPTVLDVQMDDIGIQRANKKPCVGSAGTGSGGSHHASSSNRTAEFESHSRHLTQCFSTNKRRLQWKHSQQKRRVRNQHAGSSDIEQLTDTRQEFRPSMIFMKIIESIWAIEVADGQKMFECVANKGRWQNQFEQLASGDILIICIKGENKVCAVCEVASAARTKQTNREVLKSKLQECHHAALDAYLDKAASFDYVEFKQVFDCRFVFSQFNIADSLASIGLARPIGPLQGLVRPDVIDAQWHNRLHECMQQATPHMSVSLGT